MEIPPSDSGIKRDKFSKTGYYAPSPKSSSKNGRGIRSSIYLLFFVLHPPEEVPSSEDWLT